MLQELLHKRRGGCRPRLLSRRLDPRVSFLQGGLFVSHFMATTSFVIFLHRALAKRRAQRAKVRLGGGPTQTPSEAGPSALPSAAVAAMPPFHSAEIPALPERGSGRRAGPLGEAAESSHNPGTDSTDDPPSLGGSATLTLRSPVTFQDSDTAGSHAHDSAVVSRRLSPRLPPEITGEVLDGDLRRVSGDDGKPPVDEDALAEAGGSAFDSMMPSTAEELDEAKTRESRSCAAAAFAFIKKLWDDVKEEPRVGFRCGPVGRVDSHSPFVPACSTSAGRGGGVALIWPMYLLRCVLAGQCPAVSHTGSAVAHVDLTVVLGCINFRLEASGRTSPTLPNTAAGVEIEY